MNSIQNETTTNSEALISALKKKRPHWGDILLLCVIFLAASVYLPLISVLPLQPQSKDAFSFLICALSVLAQARLSKKISVGIGQATLLLLIGLLFGGPHIAAIIGATASSACIFCWLALTTASPLVLLLPLISYGGASLAIASPFTGALSLISMPMALLLLISVRKLLSKVKAICLLSAGLLLSAILAAVLYFLLVHESITVELLRASIDSVRSALANEISTRLALLEGDMGILPVGRDYSEFVNTLANELVNHLPAILLMITNGIALITHSAMVRLLLSQNLSKETLTPLAIFDMSAVSAVVFLLSMLLSLFMDSPDSALALAVCENLYLILIPGMLISLWMYLNVWLLAKMPSCFGILLYLAVPLLLFQFPSVLLPIAAVIGAVLLLIGKIRRELHQRKS
ncbi:MAG: hypothetical protein IKA76_08145 [Clostridia bacterium]|nr:hypothetical protein [Clostridia bacterium]